MRRSVLVAAGSALLAGPIVLAFFSGGYFAEPRLIAGLVAWVGVVLVAVFGPSPLPRSGAGWCAVAGLSVIALWSAASVTWAPLIGPAVENVQRLLLYVGVLLLAIAVLRSPRWQRAVEPALAAGATIVIGYGLSGRLLPGVIEQSASNSADGRLEQPLTYWNAEGLLAAFGLILCARLLGDRSRPVWMRTLAAAATGPLGAGVYLTYSRGAIAVAVAGLLVLVAAAPYRAQLRAVVIALVAAVAGAGVSELFPGVASLAGKMGDRERDGAIALALILAIVAVTAAAGWWFSRADMRPGRGDVELPGRRWWVALPIAAVAVVLAGLIYGGLQERSEEALGVAAAERLASVSSNRYEYWKVAVDEFLDHPVTGLGSGGFRSAWLRERPIPEGVRDTHSLELEIASELGLVGLVAFGLLVGGVIVAAGRALSRRPAAAAGATGALTAWILHAGFDWDWQLPAVTIPALILAGLLIAIAEEPEPEAASARTATSGEAPATGDNTESGQLPAAVGGT
jgi:hypothetical protein